MIYRASEELLFALFGFDFNPEILHQLVDLLRQVLEEFAAGENLVGGIGDLVVFRLVVEQVIGGLVRVEYPMKSQISAPTSPSKIKLMKVSAASLFLAPAGIHMASTNLFEPSFGRK